MHKQCLVRGGTQQVWHVYSQVPVMHATACAGDVQPVPRVQSAAGDSWQHSGWCLVHGHGLRILLWWPGGAQATASKQLNGG